MIKITKKTSLKVAGCNILPGIKVTNF